MHPEATWVERQLRFQLRRGVKQSVVSKDDSEEKLPLEMCLKGVRMRGDVGRRGRKRALRDQGTTAEAWLVIAVYGVKSVNPRGFIASLPKAANL